MKIKKLSIWKADWLVGLLIVLFFWLSAGSDLIQSLERKAYDLGLQATTRIPSDRVAVIAIDDRSIANLGRWPWPRATQADMLDLLAASHAKVIGNTVLFFEPQVDAGMEYIGRINTLLDSPTLKSGTAAQLAELAQLRELSSEAATHLDNDKKLSISILNANNVLLPMYFDLGEPLGKENQPLPDYVLKNNLSNAAGSTDASAVPAVNVQIPIPVLGSVAAGIGHVNTLLDVDGAARTEPLVVSYYSQLYPSLSLLLAAKSLNLDVKDIGIRPGKGVKLGNLNIITDDALRMHTFFYKDRDGVPAFQVDSFFDVLSGKIPAEKYRDKIVLIGASAAGVGTSMVTPISANTPSVLLLAHSVSSLLKQDFFIIPAWSNKAQIAVFIAIALYLIVLLPRLTAGLGAVITGILFISLLTTHFILMVSHALWLPLMLSASMLLVGHLLLTSKHFFRAEKGKLRADAESAESNRMLGLAFQGQGQLDIAFDKFRKVEIDDSLMEVLYNLGLDFERKRQFNKAESVFKYMAEYNAKFRDLEARLAQSRAMSETLILGGHSAKSNSSTMVLDKANVSKPMLGRYEIDSELGKGAMGVVYLGKDPKIGRVVAIKTMALTQEFEADELKDVMERFFREAETAGRLNHPNIVTMYDAGEEHDLAYIAMEYIKGRDLSPHTRPDNLLPIPKVLSIVARVADALAYAHSLNVVHRDIKPANIMYDDASDTVKVTDFGIARITDSSRTKTGMVLGSPSYMSPEQLAGNKIEGASDLFSLGVSMYQLLCGKLPFYGDSMAQLMFQIAREPHVDIMSVRPDLPSCVADIIDKALAKNVTERYQGGAEMADAIRKFARIVMDIKDALEMVSLTHPGMVRAHNEDSVACEPSCGLVVLTDGMGGYNAGEVASGIAVSVVSSEIKHYLEGAHPEDKDAASGEDVAVVLLRKNVQKANSSIFNAAHSQPQYAGMGTTIVTGLFYDNRVAVAHIGDSRMYRLRGEDFECITRDHSLLQEQIDSGMISKADARVSQNKNLVTRAVGIDANVEAEVHVHEVKRGDVYLLCSDGLNDMIEDEDIADIVKTLKSNLPLLASQLIQAANDNGGRDNVSVILIKVKGDFAAPRGLYAKFLSWFKN